MSKPIVAVFGLGAVGSRLAYFLTKLGFAVVAFDQSKFLFDNSGITATNLAHNSGVEYCRRASKVDRAEHRNTLTHVRTAELCIDGGITNALLYGSSSLVSSEHISCHAHNPLQFLISKEIVDPENWNSYQGFSLEDFESNSTHLRNFYEARVQAIAASMKWSFQEAASKLHGSPHLLGKKIDQLEGLNPSVITTGVLDIGVPINQSYEYALWRTALSRAESDGLQLFFNQELNSIARTAHNKWVVETSGFQSEVDFVFLTGCFGNPLLRNKIEESVPGTPGVFYLNAMAYAKLSPTDNIDLQRVCNRGYFTLQQDSGGMGISLVPVKSRQDGYVALYYPSIKHYGSQIQKIRYNPQLDSEQEIVSKMTEWNRLIQENIPDELYERHSASILRQAIKLYPFYKEVSIEIDRLVTRSVFNADTSYGLGKYRNMRVPTRSNPIVKDGSIQELYGAKWTNASLAALSGIDTILDFFGRRRLPRGECWSGLGMDSIDVISCVDKLGLHLKDIQPSVSLAFEYSRRHGFPDTYVNPNHEIFNRSLQ